MFSCRQKEKLGYIHCMRNKLNQLMKNKGIGCYEISLHCLLFAISFSYIILNNVTQKNDLSTKSRYTFHNKDNSNFLSQYSESKTSGFQEIRILLQSSCFL